MLIYCFLLWVVCHSKLGLAMIKLCTSVKDSSLTPSNDKKDEPKFSESRQ